MASPAVTAALLTMEEFMDLPEDGDGRKMELCDGRVIYMSQPGDEHGRIAGNIYFVVRPFVNEHSLGIVGDGNVLARIPVAQYPRHVRDRRRSAGMKCICFTRIDAQLVSAA